jgi:hypothetical protein
MTIDQEMTIFYIAMFVFFICPIGVLLCGVIADQRARSHDQLTNDQPRR